MGPNKAFLFQMAKVRKGFAKSSVFAVKIRDKDDFLRQIDELFQKRKSFVLSQSVNDTYFKPNEKLMQ